jgi:uncharacterized protein
MKLIIFALVAYAIYFFFFKKPKTIADRDKDDSETMVECSECHTYISVKESIIKDAHYYCSKDCAKLK